MVAFTEEDVLIQTRTVLKGLEALREDHTAIRTGLNVNVGADDAALVAEKKCIVETNLDKISHAIEDAQMMLVLTAHLRELEVEKQMLKAQAQSSESATRRMCQENAWLRDALATATNKHQESEQRIAQLEEEIKHLEFMNSLKQFDNDRNGSDIKQQVELPKTHEDTLQELGFSPDDDEAMGGSYMQSATASAGGGHQMSARFRTAYSWVQQYASQGRLEVAILLCKQTIEDLENVSGRDNLDMATLLNVLAKLMKDNHKEAITFLSEALAIREKCLGDCNPAVASTLANLAYLYGKSGMNKEAESFGIRALEIKEKLHGQDHPNVAQQLYNLGLIYYNLGKFEEAERCYKRALEIYETKLGPDDPHVTKMKNNLSSAYLKQGKYKEAEELYKQILTRAHEREFGKVDDKNAPIWQIAEQREEASRRGEQASEVSPELGRWLKAATVDRSTVTRTLNNLGELYRREGKYAAAETVNDVLRATKQAGG